MEKEYIYKDIKMGTGYDYSNLDEIDDIVIDDDNQVVNIYDKEVIIQDLITAIRESFLLEQLIAEKSESCRNLIFTNLELLIEDDERIIPGTVQLKMVYNDDLKRHQIFINAYTYEFGELNLEIKNNG